MLRGTPGLREPFKDVQLDDPTGYCLRCGGELYSYDDADFCSECMEDNNENCD